MAKQSKSTIAPKVPDAEPVGDFAKNKVATGDINAEAGGADLSASASAAGGAPAATSSSDTSREHHEDGTGNPVGPVEGSTLKVGIDLGDGGDVSLLAVYRDGYLHIDAQELALADLMSIIGAASDEDKREIAKAFQAYFVWQDDDDELRSVSTDPNEVERDRYRKNYPHLSRAMDDWLASGNASVPTMRIVSKVDGFWRAGIKHTTKPVELSMANLTPDRAEALLSEPKLVIELF